MTIENDILSRYVDEHLYEIVPKQNEEIKIYKIQEQEDEIFTEYLSIEIDMKKFSESETKEFLEMMNKYLDMKKDFLLPIREQFENEPEIIYEKDDEKQTHFMKLHCQPKYLNTLSSYHSQNNCSYLELESNVNDLLELYKFVKTFGYDVEISFETISMFRYKSNIPFPRLCLSPYAFIKAFVNKKNGIKVSTEKSFASLFQFLSDKFGEIEKKKSFIPNFIARFMDWQNKDLKRFIQLLNEEKDITNEIEVNEFITKVKNDITMPEEEVENLTIVKKIGEGAYGAVSIVKDENGNVYALKESREYVIDELHREAFLLYKLGEKNDNVHHLNIIGMKAYWTSTNKLIEFENEEEFICECNAYGIPDDIHGYLLMEYAPEGNLEEYIEMYGKTIDENGKIVEVEKYLPVDKLKLLFGQVANAIVYLHTNRYVHRDLKPGNIVVWKKEPFPWIKLCDFGAARSNDSLMTTVHGTPVTADPRILKNNVLYTDRAELFSMGCIFYFLLYKKYPCADLLNDLDEDADLDDMKKLIVEMVENKQIVYGIPMRKMEYKPFVDLTRFLIEMTDKPLKQGETRNNEVYWDEFTNHPFAMECMSFAEEKMKQFQ